MGDTVVAVIGATGAQGGGLARALLEDESGVFTLRAVTRNPEGGRARKLAAAGAEVVRADLDDRASLERAFEGAAAAFCVTNFWEHFSPGRELAQAGNLAAAAETARVGHVIWSTLEDTREWLPLADQRMPVLLERYNVPHFDAKGEADRFFVELPVTFLRTSFYWDNFVHMGAGPRRSDDGVLTLALPLADKRLPGIASEDIGRCALGLIRRRDEFLGKTVGIAGEHPTGAEMAAALQDALGEPVRYLDIAPAAYRQLDFPGAADLGNMYQFQLEFNERFCALRNVALARSLNPSLMTFRDWLGRYARRIPVD